jgi:hypothetical protein
MSRVLTGRDVKDGFWYYRPGESFPPESIRNPEEYAGLPAASIACTQTGLPPQQQAKLVKRWCEVLPSFTALNFIWFQTQVPQALFDATCSIPNLQGLWIKWSSIKDINKIVGLAGLEYLRIGSSPRLTSIEPLSGLKNLIWLELENIKQISDLTVIGEMKQLQGLEVGGSMWSTQMVDSLAPLARLDCLRHLSLPNLKARDKTLRPLFSLSSLEQFNAALWWSEKELNQLRHANPKL